MNLFLLIVLMLSLITNNFESFYLLSILPIMIRRYVLIINTKKVELKA